MGVISHKKMKKKTIDIEALINVIPFEESGRTIGNDMQIDFYFPIFKFKDKLNDVFLVHETKKILKSGQQLHIGIKFKFPSLQIGRLTVSDVFELTEGSRTTIKGLVTKIENPLMDMSKWKFNLTNSIEQLEKEIWKEENVYPSTLVEKCHKLRKKPISELSNEELRLSFSQEIGIMHTSPIVVMKLLENKFIECNFYPGDLLQATFRKLNKDWGESNFLKDEITFNVKHKFNEIENNSEVPEKSKREIFNNLVDYENTRDNKLR